MWKSGEEKYGKDKVILKVETKKVSYRKQKNTEYTQRGNPRTLTIDKHIRQPVQRNTISRQGLKLDHLILLFYFNNASLAVCVSVSLHYIQCKHQTFLIHTQDDKANMTAAWNNDKQ